MATIFEQGKKLTINRIYAEVSITEKSFFEKQGFKIITEQLVELRGEKLTNYKMDKSL